MTTALQLAALLLLVAVPGLCTRRGGARWARAAALAALAALFVAILDPQRERVEEQRGAVVVVPTADRAGRDWSLPDPAAVDVRYVEGAGAWPTRAAAAVLAETGRRRASTVALVWNAPFDAATEAPDLAVPAVALSEVEVPRLEPADCRMRSVNRFEVGRPNVFEVELAGPCHGVRGTLAVFGAQADALWTGELDPVALAAGDPVPVTFESPEPGEHRVELVLEVAGSRIEASGSFEVAPARRVLVVGVDDAGLAEALSVQGVAVDSVPILGDLETYSVVVLLEAVPVTEQEPLVEFVRDGGGLFVVGGLSGGGVPAAGTALADLLPLVIEVPPPDQPGGAEGDPSERTEEKQPESPKADPDPKPSEDPEPPPVREPPPVTPEEVPDELPAASGDVQGAQVVEGPEQEVERHDVAIVLVVDRSRSMNEHSMREGVSKMGYAKRAALVTLDKLADTDRIGLVTFGLTGQVIVPLSPVSDRDRIERRLAGLVADAGNTLLADALRRASGMLSESQAAIRQIIVISDGEIWDGYRPAPTAAREASEAGNTVHVIQIVGEREVGAEDAFEIAKQGRGRFFRRSDPSEIPRLVTVQVAQALGAVGRGVRGGDADPASNSPEPAEPEPTPDPEPEPEPEPEPQPDPDPDPDPEPEPEPEETPDPEPADEPIALPVVSVRSSNLLAPDRGDFPAVGGILDAEARLDGEVLLVARRGDDGVPLLAFANRGLGRVGIWASGLDTVWGGAWIGDADFPARWAQWVSAVMPALADRSTASVTLDASLTPPAPVARERAVLEAVGGPLRAFTDFAPPPTRREVVREGTARELAWFGVLALVVLAVVEYLVARGRRPRAP